jgi:hypothetical protein
VAYHIVYLTPGPQPFADGPHVASTKGWADFGTFAFEREDEFPQSAYLTNGRPPLIDEKVPGSLVALEEELPLVEAAATAAGLDDVAGVARSLQVAVRHRPAGCTGLYASDGEPDEAGEDESEPYQSNVYG